MSGMMMVVMLAASLQVRAEEIVISQRAEPRSLNPAIALDSPSRESIRLLMSDLVHINPETLKTEPALAEAWKVAKDGKSIEVTLRRGLQFSDGVALTVDDVLFSFRVYQDEKLASPQRDLLLPGGKPVRVKKLSESKLLFEFSEAYAPAERIFDSVFILPRHKLQEAFEQGQLRSKWGVGALGDLAGTGPFRLAQYRAGDRAVFERNPHYWRKDKAGNRLPYLDRVTVKFVSNPDAEALQFRAGSIDFISRSPAKTWEKLETEFKGRGYQFVDAGPGLEYHFLFFNLNGSESVTPEVREKQKWFRKEGFRRAVSMAVDRESAVKLAYAGRATAIWQPVSPANKVWFHKELGRPGRSVEVAKKLLRESGFQWNGTGQLVDEQGAIVEFTVAVNAGNSQHQQMATLIEQDLRQLGIAMRVVGLEFRSLVDRIMNTRDYDAAIMALVAGDADPGPEMSVWLADGRSHFWNLKPKQLEGAEKEIDRLMREQMTTAKVASRVGMYHKVQELAYQSMPILCLVSPHILSAAKPGLEQIGRGILPPYALSKIDEMRWRKQK